MCLLFIGVLLGMALMGFAGIMSIIGAYGVVCSLWEYCPNILIGSGLFLIGVLFVTIGWSIFCKCADKLADEKS